MLEFVVKSIVYSDFTDSVEDHLLLQGVNVVLKLVVEVTNQLRAMSLILGKVQSYLWSFNALRGADKKVV